MICPSTAKDEEVPRRLRREAAALDEVPAEGLVLGALKNKPEHIERKQDVVECGHGLCLV